MYAFVVASAFQGLPYSHGIFIQQTSCGRNVLLVKQWIHLLHVRLFEIKVMICVFVFKCVYVVTIGWFVCTTSAKMPTSA